MTDQSRPHLPPFNRETALPSVASGDRVPLAGPATLGGGLEFAAEQWAACEAVSAWCEGAISPHNTRDRIRRRAGFGFFAGP